MDITNGFLAVSWFYDGKHHYNPPLLFFPHCCAFISLFFIQPQRATLHCDLQWQNKHYMPPLFFFLALLYVLYNTIKNLCAQALSSCKKKHQKSTPQKYMRSTFSLSHYSHFNTMRNWFLCTAVLTFSSLFSSDALSFYNGPLLKITHELYIHMNFTLCI